MATFRNLARVFTPIPRRKKTAAKPPQSHSQRASQDSVVAEIRPDLLTLLDTVSVSDPASREAEASIRRVAEARGQYITASAVHSYVQNLGQSKDAEKEKRRSRGFELAGELYYLCLHAEVNSLEEKPDSLGPNVFRGYCTEIFDCFLLGEHVRKGVGYPIMLMEALVVKAATSSEEKKKLYLALADQAMQSTEELARRKFEKDSTAAVKATRLFRRGDAPEPKPKSTHAVIDRRLLGYLDNLHKSYVFVQEGFENTKRPKRVSDDARHAQNRIAYLDALLQIAIKGGYPGLSATMNEIMGRSFHRARHAKCSEFYLASAQDYERLADEERELCLVRMSAHHYRKACELYTLLKMSERAKTTGSKLTKLKSIYDPEMLVISQL